MHRSLKVANLALLLLFAAALPASAQGGEDPVEPSKGSPSGFIYEIPLEGARDNAAPGGGGGTDGDDRVAIQSGDDFGSSPDVPGTDRDVADASGSKDDGDADGDRNGGAGIGLPLGGGSGSGSGDETGGAGGGGGDESSNSGGSLLAAATSPAVPFIVLGLAAAVGAGLALPYRRRQ